MKTYYVYVLLCSDGSYYTGITNNIEYRVGQHQFGYDEEAYTFTRRPVKLVHTSEFHEVNQAIAWEKHFKKWSRSKKIAFISGDWGLLRQLTKCKNKTGRRRPSPSAVRLAALAQDDTHCPSTRCARSG